MNNRVSSFLDLVRGMSAQAVLIGHILALYSIYDSYQDGAFHIQNAGVAVFFILSGFLITFSLDNKPTTYTYLHFIFDRFVRIFIAYIPALFFIAAVDYFLIYTEPNQANGGVSFGINLTMLQNFPVFLAIKKMGGDLFFEAFGTGRPLWTVAIEWWMYLLFGFLWLKRLSWRNFIWFGLVLIVPLYNMIFHNLTLVWFFGALIFILYKKQLLVNWDRWWIFATTGVALVARLYVSDYNFYDPVVLTLMSLLFAIGIVYVDQLGANSTKPPTPSMINKCITTNAQYSFSLYLLHYTIATYFLTLELHLNVWLEMFLCFVACNMVSYAFARLTEYHYHSVRKYFISKIKWLSL